MEGKKRYERFPTLARYLLSLRPGCACTCCGTQLQTLRVSKASGGALGCAAPIDGQEERSETVVLVCPNCGCEVGQASVDAMPACKSEGLIPAA